ncbi:hypothetical protein ACGFMM_08085 [Streptomyces sp. NPDC048604]|uniref:hypothetical protein n=1 Tax=Streptomyces sp. NPDC048604 TaxID=3365578 RepID=UPI00371117A4
MAGESSDESGVVWSGRLGRVPAEVRTTNGQRVLRIGRWSTVVDDRTEIRHRTGRFALSQRIIIRQPGRPPFVHRYRLPLLLQLAPYWEATYDRLSAEADDPGLGLVELLGGTDDWV